MREYIDTLALALACEMDVNPSPYPRFEKRQNATEVLT
jgi:hypothetical protein